MNNNKTGSAMTNGGSTGSDVKDLYDSWDILAEFFAGVDQRDKAKELRKLKVEEKS